MSLSCEVGRAGKVLPSRVQGKKIPLERRSLERGNCPFLPDRPRRTAIPKSLYYSQNVIQKSLFVANNYLDIVSLLKNDCFVCKQLHQLEYISIF